MVGEPPDQRVIPRVALALRQAFSRIYRMRCPWVALVTTIVVSSVPASSVAAQQPQTPRPPASTSGVITGSVTNGVTGAPIRAAVTIDRPRRAVRTDSTGRFVFRDAAPERVRLRAVAFGYEPADTLLTVVAGDTVRLPLRLRMLPQSLAPVRTVAKSPERVRFEEQTTPSVVSISGAEVRRVPAIGESDVLRSVALLPGVVARNDFSAGFNVRGGEADQNLVLLDGIPIYNPFHLGGLFGTFIDKAVTGVDVLTGAFPARYGGRLSSVLDVKSLEETRGGMHGAAELSLLSSSLFSGGSLGKGKLSWNVAVRRTYDDRRDTRVPGGTHHLRPEHTRRRPRWGLGALGIRRVSCPRARRECVQSAAAERDSGRVGVARWVAHPTIRLVGGPASHTDKQVGMTADRTREE